MTGRHQNFRNTKVGPSLKSVGNHYTTIYYISNKQLDDPWTYWISFVTAVQDDIHTLI